MRDENVYSKICNHSRIKRIDDNFVRCYDCGLSIVNQRILKSNKSREDFVDENKSFLKNFDRNFSNVIEENDHETDNTPIYEYYKDKDGYNKLLLNKVPMFNSYPHKYEVYINDSKYYLTQDHIKKIITNYKMFRTK